MAVWVQHKQNTSWEPAIVASQSSSNSYWIMQENGEDQPKVYRRTRSMLKIRCTDVQNPTPEYSHLTENQKAKFHSPYILNEERNHVRHNSVNKIPSDLVIQTKLSTVSVSDSVFARKKGGKCRNHRRCTCRRTCTCTHTCTCTCTHTGDSPRATTHSRNKEVNTQELWETSQCI